MFLDEEATDGTTPVVSDDTTGAEETQEEMPKADESAETPAATEEAGM